MKKNFKCISLFAGVGGIDLGFEQAGCKTVYANEIDAFAVKTYKENFNIDVDNRDIRLVVEDIENEKNIIPSYDILLGGFPCQAFSVAGYREGFKDKKGRGNLFFEIMKIIHHTHPKVVFLENVKNLKGHDNGKTYRIIKESLEEEGYYVHEQIMNTMNYGNIPQNRERIYIIAFRDKQMYDNFTFPQPVQRTTQLKDFIDYKNKQDDKYYYTESSFSHFKDIKNIVTSQDTIYQWRRVYVRENKSGVCPTLTANMGTGGHNVPLIYTIHGIRKLLPRECFNLQGFPSTYKLPKDMSNGRLYKQAGNSVSVSVIFAIAQQIIKVMKK